MNKKTFKMVWDAAFMEGFASAKEVVTNPQTSADDIEAIREQKFSDWFRIKQEEEI